MPRVSTQTTDDSVKRAPRKRAVRRVAADRDEAPAPRKRAPRKVTRVTPEVEVEESPVRRAPTRFAAEATSRTKRRNTVLVIVGVFAVVSGVAAWIGYTDAGQINVTARIEEESKRQPQATESVEGSEGGTVTVPVQNTPPAAISGLRGRGVGTPDIVAETPPVAEEATSTEATATSTEATAEEEGGAPETATEVEAESTSETGI